MDGMTETTYQPVVAWSKPEQERAGTPLLVLFHGYGSHEQDLMGLVPGLPEEFTVACRPRAGGDGAGLHLVPADARARLFVDKVPRPSATW